MRTLQCEFKLLRRSSTEITLAIHYEGDNPFAGFKLGEAHGQIFEGVLVPIDDDGSPEFKKEPTQSNEPPALKLSDWVIKANCLAKDLGFQLWVEQRLRQLSVADKHEYAYNVLRREFRPHGIECLLKGGTAAIGWAKAYLYLRCKISSCSEFSEAKQKAARQTLWTIEQEYERATGNGK